MEPVELFGGAEPFGARPFRGLRFASLVLLLFALALLVLAFVFRETPRSPALLLPLFLAICCATALQICYLVRERSRYQKTARAFYTTDREFRSIFQHVLDGIVILDNLGTCLDANPAALTLLRLPRVTLIGNSFDRFYADQEAFRRNWSAFLERKYQRGEVELLRSDGTKLSVSYTAAANYLPGRHVMILCDTTEKRRAESSLLASEERFRRMAENIQEIFWMMKADSKEILYVNHAYQTITGRSVESLYENPLSYHQVIHPSDRVAVLAKLEEAGCSGVFDEEFRILRPEGAQRWVWVKAFPVRDTRGAIGLLVGTVQDVTKRKYAEAQIAGHLAEAEAARAEAEALRKSTLALTQNLSMDIVLDTLLESLSEIVPYQAASVLLTEADSRLVVAREAPRLGKSETVIVLEARDNATLEYVLRTRRSALVPDTAEEPNWKETKPLARLCSWMLVPLIASDHVLGILVVGHGLARAFTHEHLRRTKSLAIAAAVAIQNARLYERAEFCSAALELRVKEIGESRN